MAGFENKIMVADNLDFSGGSPAAATLISDGELIIGNGAGNPLIGNLASSDGSVIITNGPGTINLKSSGGGIAWHSVAGTTQALVAHNGYVPMNAALTTLTLPATCVFGDFIEIRGYGAGMWELAQNALQQVIMGNQSSTLGIAGKIEASNRYDAINLLCIVTNTIWIAEPIQGIVNIT